MRIGGSTSVFQTLTNCPGQCYHQSRITDLEAIRCPRTAPREPAPEGARGENPKKGHVPNREAPREQPRGTLHMQPRRQQADVRQPTPEEPENTERARHVKVEGDGSEATREAGRQCRRARGEKSPSGDWTGLPGYLGPPRAKSIGRKGPRTTPREGLILTQQREMSMGRRGPRIRPRDEDVGGHPQ